MGTSASIATVAVLTERFATLQQQPEQTVIKETVNRIIQRPVPVIQAPPEIEKETEQVEQVQKQLSISDFDAAMVGIYVGSRLQSHGVFTTEDGFIVTSKPIREGRLYSVRFGERDVPYSVAYQGEQFSLLKPREPIAPLSFFPMLNPKDIFVGQQVFIFGGERDRAYLLSEIISHISTVDGSLFVRASVGSNTLAFPSMVVSDEGILGFIIEEGGVIRIFDEEIRNAQIEQDTVT